MSVLMNDRKWIDLTGVALCHMFVLGFFIWAGASTSGSHYNGAVTLSLCLTGHCGMMKGLWYMLSQLGGAFLGGSLVNIMANGWDEGFANTLTMDNTFLSKAGYPHQSDRWSMGAGFFAEYFATFFLVWMVYMTAVHPSKPEGSVYGLAIGGVVGFSV